MFVGDNLPNFRTEFKSNAGKLMMSVSSPAQAIQAMLYVGTNSPKGVLNCDFRDIVGVKYLKSGMAVTCKM